MDLARVIAVVGAGVALLVAAAPARAGGDDELTKLKAAPPVAGGIAGAGCATPCPSDINGSGTVNVDDLLAVINAWGPCPGCPADVNGNGTVNVDDLLTVINGWGPCPTPANDNCANWTSINVDATINFCTEIATTDGPPEAGCSFCCGDPQIHKDIWYGFSTSVFAGNYWLQADTCESNFDTKIAVYKFNGIDGCTCTLGGATLVACNDDAGPASCGLQSRVQFQLAPSSCYRIRVGGYNGQSGSGVLHVQSFINGDECFNAIDMGIVTSTNPLSAVGGTFPAAMFKPGITVTQAPCTSFPDGVDVWYKFQIGCGGNVIGSVNTCDPGTDFDTILTLYYGDCDGLTLIGCNDDSTLAPCLLNGLPRKSLVDLPMAASPGYYLVRLSGYNGATGSYKIKVGLSCIN